ncbi:MAG: TetR/AcrR family transcriptional regulator [Chlamydiales bacterium]|nr:TetR/AcrR family transcriptional regulator [Chlamydiales bacterium]
MVRIVKKPEERRREIVSAARSLFLSQGYENTTMQDMMTKLQIAKGTTYHYFKSKEELLEAVVEDMVAEYVSTIEKSLNQCKGTALEKMQILVTVRKIASPSTDTLVDALHRLDNREMHARLLAITLSKLSPLYAHVISQGCEEGVFRVEHPLECAEILLAGIQFVTDVGCHPWTPEDLERRMQAIPSLIENQLNAPKGALSFLLIHTHKRD